MYTTKAKVENYMLKEIDISFATSIDNYISYATSWIDNYCGSNKFGKRSFENPTEEVRYFDGNGKRELPIDDALEITEVNFDYDDLIRTNDLEFKPYPLNALSRNEPYTSIKLIDNYVFEAGLGNIEITGIWGYSAEPPKEIELAATKIVAGIIRENGSKNLKEETKEKFDDYSVSYSKIEDIAYSLNIDSLLKPYKRNDGNNRVSLGTIKI